MRNEFSMHFLDQSKIFNVLPFRRTFHQEYGYRPSLPFGILFLNHLDQSIEYV